MGYVELGRRHWLKGFDGLRHVADDSPLPVEVPGKETAYHSGLSIISSSHLSIHKRSFAARRSKLLWSPYSALLAPERRKDLSQHTDEVRFPLLVWHHCGPTSLS